MMNMEWSILSGYAREEEIRELFTEYTDMVLAGDPAFAGYLARQHYEEELARPARKARDDTRCELTRLYVRPEYRGQGIARALVHQLMQEARVAGYRQMVLDTFPFLPEAITLYKREGFYEIERYNDNPMPGSVYLCCQL